MPWSYDALKKRLAEAGIDEPGEEAALLLCHFAATDRASLICDRRRVYDTPGLDEAVEKRLTHYPLQYVLGEWYFFGLPFRVSPDCLIPRPDTELVVETALSVVPPRARIADLCTGSGCIAVSVLANCPGAICWALDLYPLTLRTAIENARINGVEDRFIPVEADLLQGGEDTLREAVLHAYPDQPPLLDAILSNPPYIRREEVDRLAPELSFEPRAALDGGEDGLIFYRAILGSYRRLLKPGGCLILEIGYDQAEDLRRLADVIPGWTGYTCLKDLGGHDRVICLRASQI